ncbi:fimbrial protein [Providencia manganoxydans]|uniref:Fimbrial protein n=1 Tax=Providencia stuartii TaxID=588 RepID=A0A1S1HZJ8_PROST|nr:fimbrial protein [Providencia stuartii]OHT25790.1 fimbrial protein [Providencia stuartii]
MKKLAIAAFIFGAMSPSVFAAEGGSGEVKFNGSIITAPCSIAPGQQSQEVELGQVSNSLLEMGGMSTPQPFSIKLEGCTLNATYNTGEKDDQGNDVTATYNNTISIRFSGSEWVNGSNNTGLLAITGEGRGAGVQLLTPAGTAVPVNSTTPQNFIAGDNTLRFQAALKGFQGTPVTPGNFDAVTNFVLTYN